MESQRLINFILVCAVNGIFTLAGIFLNSVVIISLWKSSMLRKGTGNFMILVLSVFDLLAILIGHPSIILNAVSWLTGNSSHWSNPGSYGLHIAEAVLLVSYYSKIVFNRCTLCHDCRSLPRCNSSILSQDACDKTTAVHVCSDNSVNHICFPNLPILQTFESNLLCGRALDLWNGNGFAVRHELSNVQNSD